MTAQAPRAHQLSVLGVIKPQREGHVGEVAGNLIGQGWGLFLHVFTHHPAIGKDIEGEREKPGTA